MLIADRLRKRYGRRIAVDEVSLSIGQGEVVGLLGPNGAGKTTCFYMIAGLVGADAGKIILDDIDVTNVNMHRRAALGLGYLPQDPSVFRGMSVKDNLLSVLELRAGLDRHERSAAAARLMQELNVTHLAAQPGMSLSGGERRRVEIARALAADPRYLLLDEPFAGIDPLSVGEMQRLVRQLKARNLGILITDHSVRETLSICDRAIIISKGRMLAGGTPDELLADPEVRRAYLGETFRM